MIVIHKHFWFTPPQPLETIRLPFLWVDLHSPWRRIWQESFCVECSRMHLGSAVGGRISCPFKFERCLLCVYSDLCTCSPTDKYLVREVFLTTSLRFRDQPQFWYCCVTLGKSLPQRLWVPFASFLDTLLLLFLKPWLWRANQRKHVNNQGPIMYYVTAALLFLSSNEKKSENKPFSSPMLAIASVFQGFVCFPNTIECKYLEAWYLIAQFITKLWNI